MNAPIGDSVGALLGLVALALGLALYVWTALALSAMFRKMGDAPYKGWVPVLNIATVLAWGGFSPWLVLIGFFPVLGPLALWVLLVVAAHRINPGFGYGGAMTVLAALLFVVWASILGFGPSRWLGARAGGTAARSREQPRASLGGVFADPAPHEAAVVTELPAGPLGAEAPPATATDAAMSPARTEGVREEDDDLARLFAPPAAPATPAWTPPEVTSTPEPTALAAPPPASPPPAEPALAVPAAGAADIAAPDEPAAPDELAPPPSPAAAVVRPPAPAPVSASAAARSGEAATDDDAAWPSEIDDVSAIAPSPFPPSSGAGWRHAMPPVTDDAPIDFVPGRRSTAVPPPHDAVDATNAEAPAPRVSAAAAAARATPRAAAEPAADASESAAPDAAALAPEAAEPPLRRARPWPAFAVAPAEPDGFPELSGEVSAVIGSPAAGSPRSAAGAVAAQHRRGESVDDDIDQTVITRRVRAALWQLIPASGAPVAITADVVILGRRPAADDAFPKAQLIAVPGAALTVSKTHARLERHDEVWTITDLASTNGVLVRTFMGEEVEVEPGSKIDAGERFFLGDEEFHLARIER